MHKAIKVLLGIFLLNLIGFVCLANFLRFGEAAELFLKGGIIWIAALTAGTLIVLGISELKE